MAERGPGRMTYAKKKIKPFAEHDLRVTLECAGNNGDTRMGILYCSCSQTDSLQRRQKTTDAEIRKNISAVYLLHGSSVYTVWPAVKSFFFLKNKCFVAAL